MKLKLKLTSIIMSAVCALSAFSAMTAVVSAEEGTYGVLTYEKTDADSDGTFDYITITGCDRSATEVSVPGEIEGLPVEVIRTYTFGLCEDLKSVTLSEGIKTIEIRGFFRCSSLTSITIPDGVEYIGEWAFCECTALEEVILPDSVTVIDWGAFEDCESLKSINAPESLTRIGSDAFENTAITNDKTGIIYLGNWIIDAIKPESSVAVENNIIGIADKAFWDCWTLETISVPANLKYIGECAFNNCDILTDINVDDNNKFYADIDGVLFNKDKTELIQYPTGRTDTEYEIPSSTKIVTSYSFEKAVNLISIIIPEGVLELREYAFRDCTALKSITIPESIEEIFALLFSRCTALESMTIKSPHCTIHHSITPDESCTIYGYENSTAQLTAEVEGCNFVSLGNYYTPIITMGDVNRNGTINLYDVIEVAKYILNMTSFDSEQLSLGDMNSDGVVNLYDAIEIAEIIMA